MMGDIHDAYEALKINEEINSKTAGYFLGGNK